MRLKGTVKNGSDGVHVLFNAEEDVANSFYNKIKKETPRQARIISSELKRVAERTFTGFLIVIDDDDSKKQVLISPDVGMCDSCRKELNDVKDRRYRYPFINCTQCGPRYSIIGSLPYERHLTAMEKFIMCEHCDVEYNNVADKRFFSQTNSCSDCGIVLGMYENPSTILSNNTEEVLLKMKHYLREGKIIAVKGVGGYLLLCDANDLAAIFELRRRKHRPTKPFAVLYGGIEVVEQDLELNKLEKNLLESAKSPIVLLRPKKEDTLRVDVKNIAPGLRRVGVMTPYSPLLDLIANDFGKPLIATSANISGSPIIYKDEDALDHLFEIADYVVSYNRDIVVPQDDSVVQVSTDSKQQIILRRARGYAPSFLNYRPKTNKCILATGAFFKSSFTLAINENVFVSQFLGSGESYESQEMYKDTLQHWLKLYDVRPDVIIADKHPDYFSHQYAVELGKIFDTKVKFVQHHEAHFAAVLAENNLLDAEAPILGVIWDGTGLGNDGNIWGGEFFKYEDNEMLRCYHFDYFPTIAGDKMALEPRIAALCAASDAWPQPDLREKFTEAEWNNYQALIKTTNLFSSSVGRIFDGVASLVGVSDKQTYEGEAAMYLQALAEEYVDEFGFTMDDSYFKEGSHYYRIPTASLMQGIWMDIKKGKPKSYVAAKFHYSLVRLVEIIAKNLGVERICFSGGVFQNALLVDWILHEYKDKYRLYFHKKLSPNDENISFGQMVYWDNKMASSQTLFKGEGQEKRAMVAK